MPKTVNGVTISRYRYYVKYKWVDSKENFKTYSENFHDFAEELFYTGINLEDLEWLEYWQAKWNDKKQEYNHGRHHTIYKKSEKDIEKYWKKQYNEFMENGKI